MAFDSLGRYQPSHKSWDHVGNVVPVVEHSEGIRPHGEFMPAAWLPVQFYEKFYEVWYVALPGKLLAFDNAGRVVPAQYGLTGANITYTDNDVEAGVIDVRTGAPLLSAATGTFAVSAVSDFLGTGEAMAVSAPVGVAPYGMFQWAGDSSEWDDGFNPAGFRQHNHNLQHRVAILCDYVLELPLVPATVAAAEALTEASNANNVSTLNAVANLPVAVNTVRTPITFTEGAGVPGDVDARFAVQKDSVDDIVAMGDWHIDYTTGVISVYSTGAIGVTDYEVTYSHYASAPTNVSRFASAVGNLKAGDFVICDANSNFAVATTEDFKEVMGQVLEVENVLDKDYLGRVRTAFDSIGTDATGSLPAYAGQMDQMPGTANGGVPGKVHYAGAANLVVRINLVSR